MKTALLEAAEKTQTAITIKEIEELEALEQFNPLSLPRLYVNVYLPSKAIGQM